MESENEEVSKDKQLMSAIEYLLRWQKANSGNTSGRCLAAVRKALVSVGIILPKSDVDYPGLFAIDCGKTLALKPGKWGWKLLGTSAKALPKDRPCLVFLKCCGWIPRRKKFAGHIAIYDPSTGVHVANATYPMNLKWRSMVAYVFVPITGKE